MVFGEKYFNFREVFFTMSFLRKVNGSILFNWKN